MKTWFTAVLMLAVPACLQAGLRVPALLGDHAMLQAEQPVAIRGWADPGARVTVRFQADPTGLPREFTSVADARGDWLGWFDPLPSGCSGELEIFTDKGDRIVVHDILVGQVWLASGQSNMDYDLAATGRADFDNPKELAEIGQNIDRAKREAEAAHPAIRFFKVLFRGADQPLDDVLGRWVLVSPENVARCSAVAWNFAVTLQDRLRRPVGIIVSTVGNTPIEAWMSRQALSDTSVGAAIYARHAAALAPTTPAMVQHYQAANQAWMAANPTPQSQFQNRRTRPQPPYGNDSPSAPNRFYNGMIFGLEPYTIRGVIWFQADSNQWHPFEYGELFRALITEWRAAWGEARLPFYFVESNNYQEKATAPVQTNPLSILREQQHAGLLLPGVDMVCAIDLGNGNPHFPNKKPVGVRLAGLALRDCYGQTGEVDSPMYQDCRIESDKVRLSFSHAAGLRVRGGDPLAGFAIRGATGGWKWAMGRIEGGQIVVWNPSIPHPVAVRYAWAVNPVTSVENGAGLPLVPFRTDRGPD